MTTSDAVGQDPTRLGAADCCDDDDAGEDVLSLCDMPLYGDAADNSFSSEDASSAADEYFEFSPRDHRDDSDRPCPSLAWDSRDTEFYGKLIPTSPPFNPNARERMDQTAKRKKTGVAKKARLITYSSARCDKWYMMAFGLARFPSEMAMSEIRRRQGKGKGKEKGNPGGENGYRSDSGEMVVSGRTRGKKGGSVWGMLKDLGCSRRDRAEAAGAVVKASFGCFPRL